MPERERRPRVSVCIPTYNGRRYIEECLDSVRGQTFGDFELLIVDDASTDGTPAFIARALRREPRLRLYRNKRNLGLVGNWNRCVRLARGEWVKFVFQDDTLAPSCLTRLLRENRPGTLLLAARRSLRMESDVTPQVKRMYRRHLSVHSVERHFPGRDHVSAAEFSRLMLRSPVYNCLGEPTSAMIHRRAFERFGLFNADLVNLCDWEFFARVAVNAGLRYAGESLATFRVHARSASAVNRRERLYRTDVIDPLIIRHELAYGPSFEPVRRAAGLCVPRVDLVETLEAEAQRAHSLARRFLSRAPGPEADSASAWQNVLRRYPRLARISLPTILAGRLDVARDLWREKSVRRQRRDSRSNRAAASVRA